MARLAKALCNKLGQEELPGLPLSPGFMSRFHNICVTEPQCIVVFSFTRYSRWPGTIPNNFLLASARRITGIIEQYPRSRMRPTCPAQGAGPANFNFRWQTPSILFGIIRRFLGASNVTARLLVIHLKRGIKVTE